VSARRAPARAWRASAFFLLAAILASAPGALSRDRGAAHDLPVQRIDVNAATLDQLRLLDGIGPKLAEAIVADREANGPFATVEDLDRVPRIGPRTILGLAPDVTLEP
jgi:competence protein ComEA